MNSVFSNKTFGHRSKTIALFWLLGLQIFCVVLLFADAAAEISGQEYFLDLIGHEYLEFAVVVALALGIGLTVREIRKVLLRHKSMEKTLKAASGAFYQLIEDRFDAWSLTPSERDVALLAIKGLSIAEIARARHTKEGTIKAQCNATYRKAGVTGRTQLLSLFIDELMGDGLGVPETAVGSTARSSHSAGEATSPLENVALK